MDKEGGLLGIYGVGNDLRGVAAAANSARDSGVRLISPAGSRVKVWIIPANGELGMARKTFAYQ